MTKPSTLPFDQETLAQGIRVRPAQFARMCDVSKQAVSQWIAQGKITLFPDGTLDPARAAREVMNNSDPTRLRAKLFRAAASDVDALRKEIGVLNLRLEETEARSQYLKRFSDEADMAAEIYRAMLMARLADIRQMDVSAFAGLLDSLYDDAIIAGAGEIGSIDEETGEPCEIMDGDWREFFVDGMAYRAAPGEKEGDEG